MRTALDIPYLPQLFTRATYRPWGAHTHAMLRLWCEVHGITMTPPRETITVEATKPPEPSAPAPMVDAAHSLRLHLDQLERDTLGATWSSHLEVTRGEYFAVALKRRRAKSLAWEAPYPVSDIRDLLAMLRDPERIQRQNDLLNNWLRLQLEAIERPPARHRPYHPP